MKAPKQLFMVLLTGVMLCTAGCGATINYTVDKSGNETITSASTYYTEEEILAESMMSGETVNEEMLAAMMAESKQTVIDGTTYYYDIPQYYTEEEFREDFTDEDGNVDEDAVREAMAECDEVELDGTTYYVSDSETSSYTNKSSGTVKANGGYFTSSTFEMPLPMAMYGATSDETSMYTSLFSDADFVNYSFTFPYKVVAANGTISDDGYTVTYDISGNYAKYADSGFEIYAAFTKTAKTATDIKISGVTNGKTYATNRKITVTSKGTVTSLKVNGKTINGRTVTLSDEGNYKVYVKLLSGKTKTVKFAIKKYHKITYNVNGGKKLSVSYKKVRYGNKYGTLKTPTRTGYKFLGWYTKKTGGTKVTSKTVCKSTATIYAHWKKK